MEGADWLTRFFALTVAVVDETHAIFVEEPHLVGGVAAGSAEPSSHEHEFARDVEARQLGLFLECALDLADDLGCESFVGVEVEDPFVLDRDVIERPIALLAE